MIEPALRCVSYHRQCSVFHAELVDGYRLERHRQEVVMEEATGGYLAEERTYKEEHPLIDFRTWLVAGERMRRRYAVPTDDLTAALTDAGKSEDDVFQGW